MPDALVNFRFEAVGKTIAQAMQQLGNDAKREINKAYEKIGHFLKAEARLRAPISPTKSQYERAMKRGNPRITIKAWKQRHGKA